jgi:hypothetical protein
MKSSQDKKKGIFSWHLVVWPLVALLIACGICSWLDKRDPSMGWIPKTNPLPGQPHHYYGPKPGNPFDWAPIAWIFIATGILYIVGCWIMYQHAKRYNRNAVRWTTAAIVFSPVLAWIAYGLSWRKSSMLMGKRTPKP